MDRAASDTPLVFNLRPSDRKNRKAPDEPAFSPAAARKPSPPRDTTERALDLGKGLIYTNILEHVGSKPPEYWEKLPSYFDPAGPSEPGLVTDFPALDIRVLFRRYPWRNDMCAGYTLDWHLNDARHVVAFFQDNRGGNPNLFCAHDWQDENPVRWQQLPLRVQSDGRYRFVCPLVGRYCDVLYLRDSQFASREAQRLYHPSQRAAPGAPQLYDREEW